MNFQFAKEAEEDYDYWRDANPKILRRIHELMKSVQATPFTGIGKPEPLRHALAGCWSRRIDSEHRLVYKVSKGVVTYLQMRYHY